MASEKEETSAREEDEPADEVETVWDRFKETEGDKLPPDDHVFWNNVYLATKLFFSGFLFMVVLCSAVVSKGVLLILTWNIFTPAGNTSSDLKTFDKLFHYNITANQTTTGNDSVTNIYYIWALFIIVVTPNLFTVLFCVWRVIFRKSGSLRFKTLLVALLPATLHSIGLSVLVFYVLPSLDPISGLWYSCSVSLIPSIVKFAFGIRKLCKQKDSTETESRFPWYFIVRIMALLLSIVSIVFWGVYIASSSSTPAVRATLVVLSILSPIFVSVSWMENFLPSLQKEQEVGNGHRKIQVIQVMNGNNNNKVKGNERNNNENDDSKKQILYPNRIYEYKHTLFCSRFKMHAVVNTWKIFITFVMVIVIHGTPCDNCLDALFGNLDQPAKQMSVIIDDNWLLNLDLCNTATPFIVAVVGISTSLFCQRLSVAAIKVLAQIQGFSVPICLVTPVTFLLIVAVSSQLNNGDHICQFPFPWFEGNKPISNLASMIIASLTGYLGLILTAGHIWTMETERMSKENMIFYAPSYCGALLEQSLMLNKCKENNFQTTPVSKTNDTTDNDSQSLPRVATGIRANSNGNTGKGSKDNTNKLLEGFPMIYFCATMWHETEVEMVQLFKSLYRMDIDQCVQRIRKEDSQSNQDYYNFEVHIFFDDAFVEGKQMMANQYVHTFIKALYDTAKDTYPDQIPSMKDPRRRITPYGGRLIWTLPGGNRLVAHLKDKYKIRRKKRWSQVMYMYYFLSHKLSAVERDKNKQLEIAKNIFILALDGDVDFRPEAVKLLIDRMKRNEQTGAACGRIHPIGDGPMVWYQKFEYAISHWLVKATEHVTGCVLCSPGCFSLFRGSALMEENVMKRYTTMPTEARHHIQYDQGEDRWLCTLLLKQGKKVDYCAGSDAFTFAPEGFKEFYNQRRRWTPSTMANILDLLSDWRVITRNNDNVSIPYICLQLSWFVSSILTPGVLLLMIIGATNLAYPQLSLHAALLINLLPVVFFVLVCFFAKTEHQLNVAAALSIIYSLIMMIVLVGLIREAVEDGFCSVITWFLLIVSGIFVLSGLTHPKETKCLIHGFLFFIAIPSMSMLLMLYSVINLNNVSWGTREAPKSKQGDGKEDSNSVRDVQSLVDRILSCSCCQPQVLQRDNKVAVQLEQIKTELNKLEAGTLHADDSQSDDTGEKHSDTATNIAPPATVPAEPYSKYLNFDPESSRKIKYLALREEKFWKWLIEKYLYPGEKANGNAEEEEKRLKEQEKVKEELKELRNKASLAYLLINALFITVIYFLQQSNVDTGGGLSVHIECGSGNGLVLEPISLAFTAVAGILLAIQFLCMLIHRSKTFLQINSITEIKRDDVDVNQLFNDAVNDVINENPEKENTETVIEEKEKPKDFLKNFIAKNVIKKISVIDAVGNAFLMGNRETNGAAESIEGTSSTKHDEQNQDPRKKFRKTVSSVLIDMSQARRRKLLQNNR
ncbi:chitin synthase chs-2-like [Ruditapes philippinarum]|uniref:chitin synthase chs-2-like n=1 Tax=Ruditapes philippinarum TaxID=129788 RepID=UPI00295A863E|nr:chitin synthase chs-2-like [Ruditapes philippinarum]